MIQYIIAILFAIECGIAFLWLKNWVKSLEEKIKKVELDSYNRDYIRNNPIKYKKGDKACFGTWVDDSLKYNTKKFTYIPVTVLGSELEKSIDGKFCLLYKILTKELVVFKVKAATLCDISNLKKNKP